MKEMLGRVKKKKYPVFWCMILSLVTIATACMMQSSKKKGKKERLENNTTTHQVFSYNLKHPDRKWELPDVLFEISGNTWIDNNHLLVIEDMRPTLYLLRLDESAVIEKTIPFKKEDTNKFDVEDIAVVNHTAYALWSHGTLFKITDWQTKPQVQDISTFLSKKNNTEGLCYDPVTQNLLIACKEKSDVDDEKKTTRAVYAYDVKKDQLSEKPFLLIHKKDLEKVAGGKIDFYPSAIAVHPSTNDIYILSTRGSKCLAQYTHGGELKTVTLLDDGIFQQPEGICFAPDGAMYISSEGKKGTTAVLYRFDAKANK